LGRNPLLAIGLGVVLVVISFLVGGATRDLLLRVAGVVAILIGVVTFVFRR
jgi:hypothetical protein